MDFHLASDLRSATARFVKKLRRESPAGLQLSQTERSTLALLSQQGSMLPGELAASEMVTNQSMSQVLAHLLELGLIERNISGQDKRKVNISLSATGQARLQQFRNERDEWLANALKALCSEEEQKLIRQTLPLLTRLTEYKPDDSAAKK